MSQFSNQLYEFGEFRLDAKERLLWRREEALILPPKVFDTLLLLLEKDGRVVSKSELMETVWAESFVEESNLSQNIYTLRRTLGVDEQGGQFIETVPRRGYRFAVPVKILNRVAQETLAQTGETFLNPVTTEKNAESLERERATAPQLETSAVFPITAPSLPDDALPEKIPAPRTLRYGLVIGLGILILAALGLGIYKISTRNGERDVTKIAPIEQLRFQRLTDTGDVNFASLSPNGELLAIVRQEAQGESVWVKQIATGSSVQTLQPSRRGYRSVAFSPDGRYLLFREEADPGSIYQTSVFGGAPKKVADKVWSDFSISPDGQQVAFVRRDSDRNFAHLLILSNFDGSGERELSVRQTPLSYRNVMAWSPDGLKLLVSGGSQQDPLSRLFTVEVTSGKETELKTPRWRAITRALWNPQGNYLIVAAREINEPTSQLWLLDYPSGEIRRLTNDLEAYYWISLSADGRMLVTRQQRIVTQLW